MPQVPTEAGWQSLVSGIIALNQEVTALVKALNSEDLVEPIIAGHVTRWQVVQSLIAHNCYHIGSIVSARRLLGLWKE